MKITELTPSTIIHPSVNTRLRSGSKTIDVWDGDVLIPKGVKKISGLYALNVTKKAWWRSFHGTLLLCDVHVHRGNADREEIEA